ncbi:MAG: presqualene diphosphate synthase HpnD [Hyphomicrobiales bacterium]|nr:presqualene diphosphate synthase HpnD [Hyphomicrobiales bacterium]MBV8825790.1 presqualene diphosphate synthase HpnD [Hyphomicrobiales bacterium]MBV9426588.1 presqualene diphosphate synthase HpnD [Bradyrhizobiaceae bacterium]
MTVPSSGSDDAARRASGSSFYAGMRMLPRDRRQAVYEIYSFCRAVDDVADAGGPQPPRIAQLAQWRSDVDQLYAGTPPPRLKGLDEPRRRFALERADFMAIIDGMEMDVVEDIRAPDWAKLDRYCDCVASAVGRLCVNVFGLTRADGVELAHHLGRALQLTNILRDLDEDASLGRLYLPREPLRDAGIESREPDTVLADARLPAAITPVLERVRGHFHDADRVMHRCPHRLVRTPRLMEKAYQIFLRKLIARGWAPPRAKVSIGKLRLLWIVARYGLL